MFYPMAAERAKVLSGGMGFYPENGRYGAQPIPENGTAANGRYRAWLLPVVGAKMCGEIARGQVWGIYNCATFRSEGSIRL
jgi:hypothetical protein